MNIRPSIAIVGAGAVGGYYGALLQRAGNDVHFLLRSDYEHVRKHGLNIESCNGDFELPSVNAYQSAADMPRCDLIIVALRPNHRCAENHRQRRSSRRAPPPDQRQQRRAHSTEWVRKRR